MLFTGYAELNIDAKGRLAIPAKYRSLLDPERDGAAWWCVPWPEGNMLRLYTETQFQAMARPTEDDPLTPSSEEAELEATYFSFTERIEPDNAGRLTLPKLHLRLTGLGAEVVVLGARNRLEVRDRETWLASQEDMFRKLPSLAARRAQNQRSNK